jgi:catechol 2,3-dioxygenase-like lactoylglutathione lyase family enzyme
MTTVPQNGSATAAEQQFADAEQQLIVRLTDDTLVYLPADGQGWQCRLSDIAWTSSEISQHGVEEVRLHAPDGHVAARVPRFEQSERFYVALLHRLLARPVFFPVYEALPTQVPMQERVLWLGAQTGADGPWEAFHMDAETSAVATRAGLLLMPTPELRVERVPWEELVAVRYRAPSAFFPAGVLRFYRPTSIVELPLATPPTALIDYCTAELERRRAAGSKPQPYRIENVEYADDELAFTYAWEISTALREGLLEPGERVVACAYGAGSGDISRRTGLPVDATAVELPEVTDDRVPGSEPAVPAVVKTELILTDRRLLQIDRDPATGTRLRNFSVDIHHMPRVRRDGAVLQLGTMQLETDTTQPVLDMPGQFIARYRSLVSERMNPFAPETDPTILADGEAQSPEAQEEELRELHRLGFISDEEYRAGRTGTAGSAT